MDRADGPERLRGDRVRERSGVTVGAGECGVERHEFPCARLCIVDLILAEATRAETYRTLRPRLQHEASLGIEQIEPDGLEYRRWRLIPCDRRVQPVRPRWNGEGDGVHIADGRPVLIDERGVGGLVEGERAARDRLRR